MKKYTTSLLDKMKRRYFYLKGTEYKTFSSYRRMAEWAKDEDHDGIYYISCPSITFKHSREEILKKR